MGKEWRRVTRGRNIEGEKRLVMRGEEVTVKSKEGEN